MAFLFRRSQKSAEDSARHSRARQRFLSLMEEESNSAPAPAPATRGTADKKRKPVKNGQKTKDAAPATRGPADKKTKPAKNGRKTRDAGLATAATSTSAGTASTSDSSEAATTNKTDETAASDDEYSTASDNDDDDNDDDDDDTEKAVEETDIFGDHDEIVHTYGGKKKALVIGILYIGTPRQLSGCANDARRMKQLLIDQYDFPEANVRLLTDDPDETNAISPTTENIRKGMEWLVKDVRAKDSLFFSFSGHGASITDHNGDEPDGMDEAICPVDYYTEEGDCILDDELHETLVTPLPAGCQMTAFFDSCHSGTVMDLPYIYTTDGQIQNMSILKHVSRKLYSAGSDYMMFGMDKVKDRLRELGHEVLEVRHIEQNNRAYRSSPARVVMFSGCKDTEYSNDTGDTGALTAAFLAVVKEDPDLSYQDVLSRVRDILQEAGFSRQTPQLSTAHEIDTNEKFVM